MIRAIALLILFMLATLVAVFAYHNAGDVTIRYVFGEVQLPMAFVLGAAFILGSIVAALLFPPGFFRQGRGVRQLNKALSNGRKELENLRNMPLQDD